MAESALLRIGVDVGGTNTDAVLMRGREVVHGCKVATTEDVMSGVLSALRELMSGGGARPSEIGAVMIGTTQFTNAIIARQGLAPVGIVRMALPATRAMEPTIGWPLEMRQALPVESQLVAGGHEFDGREISPLDRAEITRAAKRFAGAGIEDVVVAGVFSFVNGAHERDADALVREAAPHLRVTRASRIGRVGLLERENAAILNASLGGLAQRVVSAFESALLESGIAARLYLTQNDGTLLCAADVARMPVLTVASGPTNSMRGAAFLSGLRDAIVVDVGGTTSDIGVLQSGFPRQSGVAVHVGGVRTSFRMPDVVSIGLGGGSVISADGTVIGPQSVGHRITADALVFGGQTLTASDIAVAAGTADLGDRRLVSHLDAEMVRRCRQQMLDRVAATIERVRTSPVDLPVILVGGGSVLLGDGLPYDVRRPAHFGLANAVGAALAQVSGEVDRVVQMTAEADSRERAIAQVRDEARQAAIWAGAIGESLEVIDTEDVPLSYLPGNASRIRVRVVGDLSTSGMAP